MKTESIFIKDLEKRVRITETDLLPVITKEDAEGHTIAFEDLRNEFHAIYREHLIGSLAISFFNELDHALPCDGRLLLKKSYPKLFNVINAGFNQPGDPLDSFRLPDLRGRFIRGAKISILTRQEEDEGIRQIRVSTAAGRRFEEHLCLPGVWNHVMGGYNAHRIVAEPGTTSLGSGRYGNVITVSDSQNCYVNHPYPDHVYASWNNKPTLRTTNTHLKFNLSDSLIGSSMQNDNPIGSEIRPVNIPVNFFIYCE